MTEPLKAPKVFMSYCWTSKLHEEWVLHLAKQLCENGVDVILDKWNLREGQDKYRFMEQMVTDTEVRKVLVVSDKRYAEKADAREGGVGTESQIISAEIYAKVDQTKFIPVLAQVDDQGSPYLPTFMKARIYVDMSTAEKQQENFDQLLRAICDRPLHQKPEVGPVPRRIFEDAKVYTDTRRLAEACNQSIKASAPNALPLLSEYFQALLKKLDEFRITDQNATEPIDELVVSRINDLLPIRNELITLLDLLLQYRTDADALQAIHRFLEATLQFRYPPEVAGRWNDLWSDHFEFVTYESFLYLVALLVRHRRWTGLAHFFDEPYYIVLPHRGGTHQMFDAFYPRPHSLEEVRKRRLKLSRISVTADMIKERCTSPLGSFHQLMEAELIIFARVLVDQSGRTRWYPRTLLFAQHSGPFEFFARAESRRWFANVRTVLGIKDKADLEGRLKVGVERLHVGKWHDFWTPLEQLSIWINFDKLDTI